MRRIVKNVFFFMLSAAVCVSAGVSAFAAEEDAAFTDMEGYEWAIPAVDFLSEKGGVDVESSVSVTEFRPGDNITRGEFSKVIAESFGYTMENGVCPFTDVDAADWAYPYITALYEAGIVQGYEDGTFGKEAPITREELAVILYKAMQGKGISADGQRRPAFFNDADGISDYARPAVFALKNTGITNGDGNNYFNPKDYAVRAEAAVLVWRAVVK